jgi:hypothetical protein
MQTELMTFNGAGFNVVALPTGRHVVVQQTLRVELVV